MKTFSIKESIKFGWETVKAHLGFAIGTTLVYLLLSNIGQADEMGGMVGVTVLLGIVGFVIGIIVQAGYLKTYLKIFDGEKPGFMELFTNYHLFWKYLGAYILYMLIVFGGLLLLIVPGVIWAIKYQYSYLLAVDKGLRPMEALKRSSEITDGHKWHLFKFALVLIGVNILGFLCLVVGVLVTVPLSLFAIIHVYRKLSEPVAEVVPVSDAPAAITSNS